jgi:putative DNA primase/helicase
MSTPALRDRLTVRLAGLAESEAGFAAAVDARLRQRAPESRQLRRRRERQDDTTTADSYALTEAGDAEYFAQQVVGRFGFDHTRRRWYVFGPHHWRHDATNEVIQAAIGAMRERQAHALQRTDETARKKAIQWTLAGESEARLRHLLDLAATHPTLRIEGTEWDRDPWLLGVANGIVDLRTGALRPGTPTDFVTRTTPVVYDPAATCVRWVQFILEIADDDMELAIFLHRSIGYALSGSTGEQCFWIWYGLGSNGKSTLLKVLTHFVIPDHAWTMSFPISAWSEAMSEYQRAELVGRRLVIANESEESKRLNTEFVKSLTGGDTVNARHPYGRPFQFVPSAKFVLACNHRPTIRDDSHGMWRRVRLVPFSRTFTVDDSLCDTLQAEAPGILTWAIRGCLDWQAHGLGYPAAVQAATTAYQQDSDTLASFIAAGCLEGPGYQVRANTFSDAYVAWCHENEIPEVDRLGRRSLGERMKRQYRAIEARQVTYTGIGLRSDHEDA